MRPFPPTRRSDEQALLAAVNAQRAANGVPALAFDPALAAAARYQENDQVKVRFYGPYAYLADGTSPVAPTALAADFASQAAGVGDTEFTNIFAPADTGNWAALVNDWRPQDPAFARMLGELQRQRRRRQHRGRPGPPRERLLLLGHPLRAQPRRQCPAPAPVPTLNLSSLDPAVASAGFGRH